MSTKNLFLIAAFFCLAVSPASAQESLLEPTQNPDAPYRLFNTRNVYTLLKLDTRSGQLWQVQWGDDGHRFTDVLNSIAIVESGRPGRFTLYATSNIFTFILLDQDTGDTWHVQWGKPKERFVIPIEDGTAKDK